MIAEELGVAPATVYKSMQQTGINRRNWSTSQSARRARERKEHIASAVSEIERYLQERERAEAERLRTVERARVDMTECRSTLNGADPIQIMGACLTIGIQLDVPFDDAWRLARALALDRPIGSHRREWAEAIDSVRDTPHGWSRCYRDVGDRLRLTLGMLPAERYDDPHEARLIA